MNQKINLREERDFGQKINAVFAFLQQNFKPLFKSLLFIAGPFALIGGICMGIYQSRMLGAINNLNAVANRANIFSEIFTPSYFLGMFTLIVAFVMVFVVVYSYLREYHEDNEREITPDMVWNHVKQKFVVSFFSLFALMLIAYACCLVLIGFYWLLAFQFALIVIMMENKGFSGLISRCLFLIRGKWWSTFGLLIVSLIIQAVIGIIFTIPSYIGMFAKVFHVGGSVTGSDWTLILTTMISTVGATLLYAISALAIAFQYFNLVERKEGLGLLEEVGQLGKPQAVAANEGDF